MYSYNIEKSNGSHKSILININLFTLVNFIVFSNIKIKAEKNTVLINLLIEKTVQYNTKK